MAREATGDGSDDPSLFEELAATVSEVLALETAAVAAIERGLGAGGASG